MAGTQMSSILGTVTCNQTWSAQLRLRILSKGSAMLLHPLSLRLLNSFPFMTMMWLSSPLPSSSCSLWSTVHYHHQRYTMFLHTLVRDFYPAHVLKHHMPCEPKVTWKVCLGHSRSHQSRVKKPALTHQGFEDGISFGVGNWIKGKGSLIACSYYLGVALRLIHKILKS